MSALAMRKLLWPGVAGVWTMGIAVGLALLTWYDTTEGLSGPNPQHWPTSSGIERSTDRPTLVMFAHPRCPCTRSSLKELAKIVARCPGAVSPCVVFFRPSSADKSWERTDQWHAAAAMPRVRVMTDIDGVEARHFQAFTSGQTLLYSAEGELLFSGGITLARGHEGDNAGRLAIESLLTSSTAEVRQTPVFGCPILISTAP
jgi:hypothetical protein